MAKSNSFLSVETGWAITAHAVGLGRPMDEHLETTGKAVPGYDGTTLLTCHAWSDVTKIGRNCVLTSEWPFLY